MMGMMVLLLVLWFGLLVPSPRGVGWFMRFVTGPCCLGHRPFGFLNWSVFLQLLSVLMILLIGHTLWAFWLTLFIGLLAVLILG